MKKYSLDVEPLREFDGGSLLGYYSRGHHDSIAFLFEAADCADQHGRGPFTVTSGDVKHEYWRCVPAYPTTGEHGSIFHIADGPARGAFPVTVVYV